MRNLIVAYRLVPDERVAEYDRVWLTIEDAARSCELRAWRFRSLEAGDEFVEFIEGADVERNAPFPVETIRRSLDRIAPAISDRSSQEAPPAAEPQPSGERAALLALLRHQHCPLGSARRRGG